MKNALILHGTGANSQSNWFPWLKEKLESRGYEVWVPDLPNSMYPDFKLYTKYILDNWEFDQDSIIIGHSSGAVLTLYVLQNLPQKIVIDRAFIIAGFINNLGWPNLENLFFKPLNWEKIKKKARKIYVLHSDNDPYVPLKHGELITQKLNAELIVMKGQEHLMTEIGTPFGEFPSLLKIIASKAKLLKSLKA